MSDFMTRRPAQVCRMPEPADLVCLPGRPNPDAAHFDAVYASHSLVARPSRLGDRPLRPHGARAGHSAPRPAGMHPDRRRAERGIGVRAFNRKIGDTYTQVLNLRGVLEVQRNFVPEQMVKLFGVLINQHDQALAALENRAGTSVDISELRRIQGRLDDVLGAIQTFAALGKLNRNA